MGTMTVVDKLDVRFQPLLSVTFFAVGADFRLFGWILFFSGRSVIYIRFVFY